MMPYPPGQDLTITIRTDKVFDDFIEMVNLIRELGDFIPEWQEMEARPVADKIVNIMQSWITTKQGE